MVLISRNTTATKLPLAVGACLVAGAPLLAGPTTFQTEKLFMADAISTNALIWQMSAREVEKPNCKYVLAILGKRASQDKMFDARIIHGRTNGIVLQ